MLNGSQPGSSQIFNNHIPLDPQIIVTLAISKTTPLVNVTRGQLVPYVMPRRNSPTCVCRRAGDRHEPEPAPHTFSNHVRIADRF
jgi:hypothetical protein